MVVDGDEGRWRVEEGRRSNRTLGLEIRCVLPQSGTVHGPARLTRVLVLFEWSCVAMLMSSFWVPGICWTRTLSLTSVRQRHVSYNNVLSHEGEPLED